VKKVWTILLIGTVVSVFGLSGTAYADMIRLYPYNEAANPLLPGTTEWSYNGNDDGYSNRSWFHVEGDAIYFEALALLNPNTADAVGIMEYYPNAAAAGVGPIDGELEAITGVAANQPEIKRGVALASTGTIQGTLEFDTKMTGDGSHGQRTFTFLQIEDQSSANDFRAYQLSMGNPGSTSNFWYLKVWEWDESGVTTWTELTALRQTWTLPYPEFDLDVWRNVRIQLSTTTATTPDTVTITIYVDGVQVMSLADPFTTGTAFTVVQADLDVAAWLPIHFKFQEGFSSQRKYIRNLKYFNGSPTSEPDVLPLTGTETETIMGLGSVRAAAFAKETPYRQDKTYPGSLKAEDRIGGIQIATVGGVGGFYWDGYTKSMLNYTSSTAELNRVQFSPAYDGRGQDKNWIAMSSSGADAKTYIYSVQTGNALQTAGLNGRFLSFSPNGDMVACSLWEDLLLYDSESGTLLRTIIGHSGEITSAKFSKNGQFIVTGSDDGTARLFNANSGLTYRTFIGHTEPVTSVDIYNSGTLSTPGTINGTLILTGSEDNSAKVWDYFSAGADTVTTLSGHTDDILSVAISPDSSKYLTGSNDKSAKIWTIVAGTPSSVNLTGHTAGVSKLVFSPTGEIVVTSSAEETKSWTVAGTAMYTYTGELLDTEDNFLRLLTFDRQTTKIWNTYQGESQDAMNGHSGEVVNAFYSADEEYSFSVSADGTGKLWGADTTDTSTYGLEQSSVAATDAAFSPDNPTTSLLTGNKEGVAHLWKISTMAPFFTVVHGGGAINSVAYSSDGERLLTGGADGKAKIWNANNGNFIRELDHGSPISEVRFTSDRTLVITASPGGTTVKVWKYIDGTSLATINQVFLAISPDGKKLLTAGVDANSIYAYVYNLANPAGTPVTLTGHTDTVNVGMFSPDSSKIMTGSDDESVRTWDATTGALGKTLTGHTKAIVSLNFNTAGNTGLSGSEDSTARVWDLDTGFLSRTFSTHTGTVNSVAFSTDEAYVLTGSDDGSSRYYFSLSGAGSFLLSIVPDTNSFVSLNTKKSFTIRMSEMSGVSAFKIVMLTTDNWCTVLDDTETAPYNMTLDNTAAAGWTWDVQKDATAGAAAFPVDWPDELGTTNGPWPLTMTIITAHRGTNPPLPTGEGAIAKFTLHFPPASFTTTTSPTMLQVMTKPDTETVAVAGANSKSFVDQSPVSVRNITPGDLVEEWSNGALKDYEPFRISWLGVTDANQNYFFLWGDVAPATLDGVPGAQDAASVLLYDALSLPGDAWPDTTAAPAFPPAADVSGDGVVGAYDASLLIQYDAFMIDTFPADSDGDGYGPENSVVTKRVRTAAASSASLLASVADNAVTSVDSAEDVLSLRLVLNYDASQFAVAEDSVQLLVPDALGQIYANDQNGRLVVSISLATALEAGPANIVSVKLNPVAPVVGDPVLVSVDAALTRLNDGQIAIAPGSVSAITVSGNKPADEAPAPAPAPGTIVVGEGSDEAAAGSNPVTYSFDEDAADQLKIMAPGDLAMGDVSSGAVSAGSDDEAYTDGVGLVVALDAGEGATMLGDPMVAGNDYIFLRVSAKTSSAGVSIGLGGLDAASADSDNAGLNGSIGLTILNDPQRVLNQYGYVDALCKSERGAIVPVLQVVNSSDEAVTVEFDNLSLIRISADDVASAWMLE